MKDHYTSRIQDERFTIMKDRYMKFLEICDDVSTKPINVFNPLPQKALEDLELIREVSVYLQKKKNEDVKKAAQVADEDEEKSKETVKEENADAKAKPETENSVKENEN